MARYLLHNAVRHSKEARRRISSHHKDMTTVISQKLRFSNPTTHVMVQADTPLDTKILKKSGIHKECILSRGPKLEARKT